MWVPLKKHRCLPKPDLSGNTDALIPSLVIGFSWLKPTSGWEDNTVGRVLVSKAGWSVNLIPRSHIKSQVISHIPPYFEHTKDLTGNQGKVEDPRDSLVRQPSQISGSLFGERSCPQNSKMGTTEGDTWQ